MRLILPAWSGFPKGFLVKYLRYSQVYLEGIVSGSRFLGWTAAHFLVQAQWESGVRLFIGVNGFKREMKRMFKA